MSLTLKTELPIQEAAPLQINTNSLKHLPFSTFIQAIIWAHFVHDIFSVYSISLRSGGQEVSPYASISVDLMEISVFLFEVPFSPYAPLTPSSSPEWFCVCHLAYVENEVSGPWKFGDNPSTWFHVAVDQKNRSIILFTVINVSGTHSYIL